MVGRLVELFTDGVPTVAMSLYLSPHTLAVSDAVRVARATGLPVDVTTIAEAVGSDVTNVVRSCVDEGRFGAAAHVLTAYLCSDVPRRRLGVHPRPRSSPRPRRSTPRHGTRFAEQCRDRIAISYPAIDTADYLDLDPAGHGRGPGSAAACAPTATCSSCPGWPTPRASTT